MKWTSGSDLNVSNSCRNGGAAATFPFMVYALKDFKAWRISQPFHSCEMSVRGCQMALVCQKVVSQLLNTLRNGVLAAKWRISRRGGFATISQLPKGCTGLRNGTRVPWGLFAAAKIFTEGDIWAAKWFPSKVAILQRSGDFATNLLEL